MAQSSGFVPAWKRLGLKLTHFQDDSQSGDAVPDFDGQQSTNQESGREGSRGDKHQNDHISRLGKRKSHDAPEDHDQVFKRSKNYDDQEPPHGTAQVPLVASGKEETEESNSGPQVSLTAGKPQGDSNYRKKKTRGEKTFKKRDQTAAHSKAPAEASQKQPSPSAVNTDFADDGSILLPSTELDFLLDSQPAATTKRSKKSSRDTSRDIATLDSTPPRTDRRKSVTFTPDTKTADGNSASNLFKKWVLDQKGADADFSAAEIAEFDPPPKVHPANGVSSSQGLVTEQVKEAGKTESKTESKTERKTKKKQKEASAAEGEVDEAPADLVEKIAHSTATRKPKTKSNQEDPKASIKPEPKGKKKDPSVYLSYLSQYHTDRDNWKFNKAKQNDVIDNALNIFRIPDKYTQALVEYTKGLKGASIVARQTERCNTTLRELDEEEKNATSNMDDAQMRELAKQEALEERRFKEKRRRELDGDIETLSTHPYSDGFIRRLKRRRADALLTALNLAAPIRPAPAPPQIARRLPAKAAGQKLVFDEAGPSITPKPVRKRKSRTDVSSNSSSSSGDDSSSDDSSSSDSDSDDDDEETQSTSSSSDSESEDESGSSKDDESDDTTSDTSGSTGSEDDKDNSSSSSDSD